MTTDVAWLVERPIAHRGMHRLTAGIPENSLAAFEAAVAAVTPIELDVQQLGDGTIVVFHDDDLARACGVPRSLSAASQSSIQSCRLFGTDQRIPLFAEVLQLVDGRVPLLVEIKNPRGELRIARAVHEHLQRYTGPYAVQSFDPVCLGWFARHAHHVPRGQLGGPLLDDSVGPIKRVASRLLLTSAISWPQFVNYDLRALPDRWVNGLARWMNVPLLCWTVRTAADRAKAEALGVNYVFDPH